MSADPGAMAGQIRLVVAGGRPLFRGALLERLQGEEDVALVGDVAAVDDLLNLHELSEADVALMDSDFEAGIVETAAALTSNFPGVGLVLLTGTDDLQALLGALEAGVRGCVAKNRPIDELILAIRAVSSGGAYIGQFFLARLLDELLAERMQRHDAMRLIAQLSRREREVLRLLSEGASGSMIAERLVIAPDTARTHVQNVLRKLGVHSRLEAAAFAARNSALVSLLAEESRARPVGATAPLR